MRDAGGTPGVGPLARIAAEVDARGGVADLQQRPGNDSAGRGDESEGAVALLGDAERGDRTVAYVELHRYAPAALAVVDAQAAQQRAAVADRQVGRTVVAHLDHPVAVVQRLQLGERPAA